MNAIVPTRSSIMTLYTRTGDGGETSLFDGSRVRKDDPRIVAFGAMDELNAHLGVAAELARQRGQPVGQMRDRLVRVQHDLFALGAELATPSGKRERVPIATGELAARYESWIDEAAAGVEPLREFILPGGDALAAQLHVCRTVCRRAEQAVAAVAGADAVNPHLLSGLNRLSDLFFAWARLANHLAQISDVPWSNPGR
ncbi:MAG: cob(I)yrinic acid a,c-diamide adenosyltransferase [Phycisphaerae bacterium]